MEKIKDYEDLKIWQKGIEIVKDIYGLTDKFPKEEMYGLASQMKRAAISIPSNIAEGFERFHGKEYKQYLRISLGSSAELSTQTTIAKELKFIDETSARNIKEELKTLSKMISTLIKKLN